MSVYMYFYPYCFILRYPAATINLYVKGFYHKKCLLRVNDVQLRSLVIDDNIYNKAKKFCCELNINFNINLLSHVVVEAQGDISPYTYFWVRQKWRK